MDIIKWSGMTHPGRRRKNNEDGFLGLILFEHEAHHLGKEDEHALLDADYVFAVSDGMGGANAGDFASKLALQSVIKRLPKAVHKLADDPDIRTQAIYGVFEEIHDEIVAVSRYYSECKGMGATLSLCWVHGHRITFGHIGDSRIYHIPKEEPIAQITEDHSEVGRLFRQGKLNERSLKNHPYKHILDQALGGNLRNIDPQVGEFSCQPGDYVILCSDGICDGLYNRTIESTIVRPSPNIEHLRWSERLVKEALFSSSSDNLTAMVIQFAS